MAENPLGYGRPQPSRSGAGTSRESEIEAQRDFWRLTAIIACTILVLGAGLGVVGFLVTGRPSAKPVPPPAPEVAQASQLVRPSEIRPVPVAPTPVPTTPGAPTSPGIILKFGDLEGACGDLANLQSYLCLVNRGSELAAGGARQVVTEDLASFSARAQYRGGISVNVEGKERYSFEFGPPKGKSLLPGLYSGAMRWPFNNGPYPGMSISIGSSGGSCEEGQFRILEFDQQGDGKVLRFIADFDCTEAIGRIAVTKEGQLPGRPIEMHRHVPEGAGRR